MKKNVNIGYLVFLSFVAALGGFLFGYDTAVISGTIAQVTVLFHFLRSVLNGAKGNPLLSNKLGIASLEKQ